MLSRYSRLLRINYVLWGCHHGVSFRLNLFSFVDSPTSNRSWMNLDSISFHSSIATTILLSSWRLLTSCLWWNFRRSLLVFDNSVLKRYPTAFRRRRTSSSCVPKISPFCVDWFTWRVPYMYPNLMDYNLACVVKRCYICSSLAPPKSNQVDALLERPTCIVRRGHKSISGGWTYSKPRKAYRGK